MTTGSADNASRLYLPHIAPAEVAMRNELFTGCNTTELQLAGEVWRITFQPRIVATTWRFRAYGLWGETEVMLFLDTLPPLANLPSQVDPALMASVPEPLLAAAYEALLEDPLEALEHASGLPLVFTAVRLEPEEADDCPACIPFSLHRASDGRMLHGMLAFAGDEQTAYHTMQEVTHKWRSRPPAAMWTDNLSLGVIVEAGEVRLALRDLFAVAPRDILLLDTFHPATNSMVLRVAGGPCLRARYTGTRLTIEETLMTMELEDRTVVTEATGTPRTHDLKSIEVPVRLEIETLTMTVAQLGSLSPGYIMETTRPLSAPVTLSVNGKAIGTGEILDVGGRIGVRILTIGMSDNGMEG